MAKFEKISQETQELFDGLISSYGIDNYINIEVLSLNTLKQLTSVVKANELTRHKTNIDIFILVNENIFDKLEDNDKKIMAEHAIAGVSYNTERDKLEIKNPDIIGYSGVLKKYGNDEFLRVNELVNLIFKQEKDKESDKKKK
jgi:hypothetical protein